MCEETHSNHDHPSGGPELRPFRTLHGRLHPCGDVWHRSWSKLRVRHRAGRRWPPRLKSQPPPHARRRATQAPDPNPSARTTRTSPSHVCRLPDAARPRRIARDAIRRRPTTRVASKTWVNIHNTQRLLPDQKRRLERRVPPHHICQTSERRGEPRAVPPHGNHVRPVAPLIIQRVVVAAPQR